MSACFRRILSPQIVEFPNSIDTRTHFFYSHNVVQNMGHQIKVYNLARHLPILQTAELNN